MSDKTNVSETEAKAIADKAQAEKAQAEAKAKEAKEGLAHRLKLERFKAETSFCNLLCQTAKLSDAESIRIIDSLRDYLSRKASDALASSELKKVSKADKEGFVKMTFSGGNTKDRASLWSDISKACKLHAEMDKLGISYRINADCEMVKRITEA